MADKLIITAEEAARHVRKLQDIGDQMEAAGDPRWLPIARAAALIEGLRLGITEIAGTSLPNRPIFFGMDRAVPDTDQTVVRKIHA